MKVNSPTTCGPLDGLTDTAPTCGHQGCWQLRGRVMASELASFRGAIILLRKWVGTKTVHENRETSLHKTCYSSN